MKGGDYYLAISRKVAIYSIVTIYVNLLSFMRYVLALVPLDLTNNETVKCCTDFRHLALATSIVIMYMLVTIIVTMHNYSTANGTGRH